MLDLFLCMGDAIDEYPAPTCEKTQLLLGELHLAMVTFKGLFCLYMYFQTASFLNFLYSLWGFFFFLHIAIHVVSEGHHWFGMHSILQALFFPTLAHGEIKQSLRLRIYVMYMAYIMMTVPLQFIYVIFLKLKQKREKKVTKDQKLCWQSKPFTLSPLPSHPFSAFHHSDGNRESRKNRTKKKGLLNFDRGLSWYLECMPVM